MDRTLWVVSIDQQPKAVLVANEIAQAQAIAQALMAHGDLPPLIEAQHIQPCPPPLAKRTVRRAASLGFGRNFLACVGAGMFLTDIGGLGPEWAS